MSDQDITVAPDDYTAKLMAEVERLQAENEKLRLLVRALDYCSSGRKRSLVSCERCPLYDVTDVNIEPKCVQMMREMEIDKEEI